MRMARRTRPNKRERQGHIEGEGEALGCEEGRAGAVGEGVGDAGVDG
jgi:hypothetical protein